MTPRTVTAEIFQDDCLTVLPTLRSASIQLIITSPPYNIGKSYERRVDLDEYLDQQSRVIAECVRLLRPGGSICWQVGNWVQNGEIVPLDIALFPLFAALGLKCRNRIIWHFEHGLHCSTRLSGRHETVLWFTKPGKYLFNVDPIRVPQKYPAKKHFKGPRLGQLSGNPLGKNPGDVWLIPNVKHNHIEKTDHPCQFPVELVERFVLSMTTPGDIVLDPFAGVGSAAVAATIHKRNSISIEVDGGYCTIARQRIEAARKGTLKVRPMDRPIYQPNGNSHIEMPSAHMKRLLEQEAGYKA